MAVWSDYTWIVVTGCLAAFFTAYGIGANDVANAFGSSVAARTLTMRQALLIATVCEFGGSVLLGGEVTRTVASGIAKLTAFELNPEIYMYGMLCALVSSGTWLIIATYLELPVSTTHSIAGAVLGFAFVYGGPNAVIWLEPQDNFPYMRGMVPIVVSWFVSPLMSGLATAMLFFIVRTAILRRERSLELAFWALPVLVLVTVFINVYFVLYKGADARIQWSSNKCAWVSACTAAGCTVLTIIFGIPLVRHYVYKDIEARRLQQLSEMENHTRGSCRNSRTCGGSGGCPVLHNHSIRSVEPTPSAGGSGGGVEMKPAGRSGSGVSGDSGGCGGGAGNGPAAAIPFVEYRAPPPPPPPPPSTRQRHEHVAPQQQQHLHIGCESASSARQQQACRPMGQLSLLSPPGPAHSSYSSISRTQRTQPLPPLPPPQQQQDQERQLLQPHQKEVGEQPQCRESPAPMPGNCEGGAQLHEGSGGSRRYTSPPLSLSLPRQQTTTPDALPADGVSGGLPDGAGGTISSGGDAALGDHGIEPQGRDGPQILVPAPPPPPTQQQNQEQHLMLQGPQQQQLQPLNIQAPQQMQMQAHPWIHQMQQHQQEQLLLQQQWLNQQWLQQHQQEQFLLNQQWLLQQQPYLQHRNQDVLHPHQQWALLAQSYPQQEQMQVPDGVQQHQHQQRCQQFPIVQMPQHQSHILELQQEPPRGMQHMHSTQHHQQLAGQWRAPINTCSANTAAGMQQGYELSQQHQYQYQGDRPPQPQRQHTLTPPGPIAESLEWGRKSVAPSPDEDSQGKGAAEAAAADDNRREAPEPKVQWQNTFDQLKAIVLRGTQVAVHDAIITDPTAQRIHTYAEVFDPATEDAFKYLQVVTAICDSFSHGANDVANSVGPLAAIWYIYRFQRVDYFSDLPIWILVLGGAGIVVGLATYGYNIIRAIGVRLSVITPSRGFCIELSTALVVAIASKYGIPLSTTHCQVGATAGMGLMEGSSGLHWRLVMQFFAGWVFTLILTGLMAAALFAAGAYAPCIQQGRDILKYETALLDLATTIDLLLNRSNYAALSDSRTWGNFSAALNTTMATGIQSLRMYSQAANTATGTRPVQYIDPGPLLDLVNTTMSAYYNNTLPYIGGMAAKGITLPRRP